MAGNDGNLFWTSDVTIVTVTGITPTVSLGFQGQELDIRTYSFNNIVLFKERIFSTGM